MAAGVGDLSAIPRRHTIDLIKRPRKLSLSPWIPGSLRLAPASEKIGGKGAAAQAVKALLPVSENGFEEYDPGSSADIKILGASGASKARAVIRETELRRSS